LNHLFLSDKKSSIHSPVNLNGKISSENCFIYFSLVTYEGIKSLIKQNDVEQKKLCPNKNFKFMLL